jgi:hypothetical protein
MEIKGPRPGGPLPPVADNNQPVNKFSKASRPVAAGAPQAENPLQAIAAEYSKADLKDPAKVDQILSRCTNELLQSALQRSGGKISPEGGATVNEWLQNDPHLRGKLLNYLERVLT